MQRKDTIGVPTLTTEISLNKYRQRGEVLRFFASQKFERWRRGAMPSVIKGIVSLYITYGCVDRMNYILHVNGIDNTSAIT